MIESLGETEIKTEVISIDTGYNVIIGRSHFIKTVEDIYEAIVNTNPKGKFGLAFCEASADRLVRFEGNDEKLVNLAVEMARKVNAGHYFFLVLDGMYPINILNALKQVREVCSIECASQNPLHVIVGETSLGRTILGIVDGQPTVGVEDETKKKERHEFLRKIGYKF